MSSIIVAMTSGVTIVLIISMTETIWAKGNGNTMSVRRRRRYVKLDQRATEEDVVETQNAVKDSQKQRSNWHAYKTEFLQGTSKGAARSKKLPTR